MAVITPNGYAYHTLGGASLWFLAEYPLYRMNYHDTRPDLPPYPVRPPWRRAIRTISAT
jgi:hypothetical protein